MNIYIDESGSINNKNGKNKTYFVIAMVRVHDRDRLKRAYKRFVSSNMSRLQELDAPRTDPETGKVIHEGNKMFHAGKFVELKGSQFDPDMKRKFLEFITRNHYFEVYFIRLSNQKLTDEFCQNTARVFNYSLRLALQYFIGKGMLPDEKCVIQSDERNERPDAKRFLENYLNTELMLSGWAKGPFSVQYFPSENNCFIQIADVFANWFYSQLLTNAYTNEFVELKKSGIIKCIFDFPLS